MVGPSPADEEALKKNTDCVYFLASPLTCKKGSECEYRHSEIARVNPRDCWFWLHGNCLNPKCGFRHPPLDGLLGTQTPTPTGHSLPPTHTITTPATAHAPNASGKPGVPCIFFQKGLCLKGDWCPFLHTPNSASNKALLVPGTASAAENATLKKALGGPENFAQEKKVPPIDIDHSSVKLFSKAKPAVEVKPVPPRNEFSISRRTPHTLSDVELPGYMSVPPVTDGNQVRWSVRAQQHHLLDEPGSMYNKDAEEVSREPSPGFDVLVDDERRDSDYYPSEDQYGMPGEHEARNEYDIDHATDYNMIADIESERFQDLHGYDSHELLKGRHVLEQHRASSERMSGGSYLERRQYAMADNQNKVDELDLRHRLAKRKKSNGLRSVISHDHARDRHVEDRRYQGLHRDDQNVSLHENSLSSRLRGRIKLPGRSSPPSERNIIRGPDRGKLSPVGINASSLQGRIRDRIKGRVEENFHDGGKNHRGLHLGRDMIGDNAGDFTGPKSLAELKNWKNVEPGGQYVSDQQSLGKRKNLMLDGYQQSGSDLSFEGPKPLEEILKRKRVGKFGTVNGQKTSYSENIIEDNNKIEGSDAAKISLTTSEFVSSESNNETIIPAGNTKDASKFASADNTETEESRSVGGNSTALRRVARKVEAEDGTVVEDGVDQDGESDYEQMGGEDFDLYDGENGDADGEYLEDEDDDDFAKKMGVMYS